MLADGFTKALPKDRHHNHAEKLGIELQLLYACANCCAQFPSKSDLDVHANLHDDGQIYGVDGKRKRSGDGRLTQESDEGTIIIKV